MMSTTTHKISIVRWPRGPDGGYSIVPVTGIHPGRIIVGEFHTHPGSPFERQQLPYLGDHDNQRAAWETRVPGLVISHFGVGHYGPDVRQRGAIE
jgi:hypothetical protein